MPTIEIPNDNWRPSGGRLIITDPATLLRPKPGIGKVTLLGGVQFKPGANDGKIDPDVTCKITSDDTWRGEGVVMICADRIAVACTILGNNLSCQGVHISDWYGNTPNGGDLSGLRVSGIPYSTSVGTDHCVYFRAGKGFVGTNLSLSSAGGGGLHFYSAAPEHVITNNMFTQVTYNGCFADTYTWGPGAYGNHVTKQLSLNVGPRGHNVDDGTNRNDVMDFVTVPTPGYGYVAPQSAADLARTADAAFRATTITYEDWAYRVQTGFYTPADGSGTKWGQGFAALAKITS